MAPEPCPVYTNVLPKLDLPACMNVLARFANTFILVPPALSSAIAVPLMLILMLVLMLILMLVLMLVLVLGWCLFCAAGQDSLFRPTYTAWS